MMFELLTLTVVIISTVGAMMMWNLMRRISALEQANRALSASEGHLRQELEISKRVFREAEAQWREENNNLRQQILTLHGVIEQFLAMVRRGSTANIEDLLLVVRNMNEAHSSGIHVSGNSTLTVGKDMLGGDMTIGRDQRTAGQK